MNKLIYEMLLSLRTETRIKVIADLQEVLGMDYMQEQNKPFKSSIMLIELIKDNKIRTKFSSIR